MLTNAQKSKVAQILHRILTHGDGIRMGYTKALKLLYLIDRRSLKKFGFTVTDDDYQALKNGPVLIETMQVLRGEEITDPHFAELIGIAGNHQVFPTKDTCDYDLLSDDELSLIDDMAKQYGKKTTEELIELTHQLPEWKETGGSRIRISLEGMARALIKDKKSALQLARNAEKDRALGHLLNA